MPLASAHPSAPAPNLTRMTDGRLVCAFQTDEDWPPDNPPPNDWLNWWDAHAEVKAVTCTDWGQVWSPAFLVASERNETPQRHCAWAGLVRLRDERLLCTFNSGPPDQDPINRWAVYNNTESTIINYPQLLEAPALNDHFNGLNPDGTPFLWGLLGDWTIESDGSHGNVFTAAWDEALYPVAWCGNTIWQNYSIQAEIKLKTTSAKAGVLLRILPGAGHYKCYVDKTLARFGLTYVQYSPPAEQYWEIPSSFVVDQWYTIRVKAIASVFYCYLGDSPTPLLTVTCTGSPTGSVGLQVDQGVASFDNVKVEELP